MRPRFLLLLVCLLVSCSHGRGPAPGRTLEAVRARLSPDLTPALAAERLGPPDEVTGSGLLIYVYRVEHGRSVYLFFPGFEPIRRAAVREPSGAFMELPLPEAAPR
jgi:hypothetical protein